MEIYALKGHRVRCTHLDAMYEYMKERNQRHLEVGKVYTVEMTEVYGSFTNVELQEFPGVEFTSTNFEDVEPQSESDSKRHPNYFGSAE